MYANEVETKEKCKITWDKKLTTTHTMMVYIYIDWAEQAPVAAKGGK